MERTHSRTPSTFAFVGVMVAGFALAYSLWFIALALLPTLFGGHSPLIWIGAAGIIGYVGGKTLLAQLGAIFPLNEHRWLLVSVAGWVGAETLLRFGSPFIYGLFGPLLPAGAVASAVYFAVPMLAYAYLLRDQLWAIWLLPLTGAVMGLVQWAIVPYDWNLLRMASVGAIVGLLLSAALLALLSEQRR